MLRKMWVVTLVAATLGCTDDNNFSSEKIDWEKLGLEGKVINELSLLNDDLYAATDDGLYRKNISNNTDWMEVAFKGINTRAFLAVGASEIYVSTFGTGMTNIHRSTDGGSTWAVVSPFDESDPEQVNDLEYIEGDNMLLSTGNFVVAKSDDNGSSWTTIWGEFGTIASGIDFVSVNPQGGDIWAGGQNAIEESVLIKSKDNGATWELWRNLLPAPSTGKDIAFDPQDDEVVFVGFEGGITKTIDGGDNWTKSIESEVGRFFFGVEVDNQSPNVVYASGWLKGEEEQPLILFVSEDAGSTWKSFENRNEKSGGVLTMAMDQAGRKTVIYLGLDKGGVYKVNF